MFEIFPLKNGLENVEGFYFGGINSGFKKNENDLGFIRSDEPFFVSAVFTANKFQAAPIRHFLRYQKNFKSNFLLVNSKNANAMTGEKGVKDIDEIFENLSKKIELINPIMSSTGVIGYRLKKDKILQALSKINFSDKNSDAISHAIMTTDTQKKELAFEICLENGEKFNIAAICKGAGMINPNFATMLCFILTDAKIPQNDMEILLKNSVKKSFNCISVDGDTSTNDTVMLFSSQKKSYDKEAFEMALNLLTKELSLMVIKDAEGGNKLVKFEIVGAKNDEEAQIVAKKLSNSPLVKTAIFGGDPNWGRIASTIGASGICCDEEKLSIWYDDVLIYDKDKKELDEKRENLAANVMQKDNFTIKCDLGINKGKFTAFGCDLSYEYIKINADYRS